MMSFMSDVKVTTTDIPGLLIYEREVFSDNRGFFHEVVELQDLEKELGTPIAIKQWNHSQSLPGVIRGFHAEPWEKIIYPVRGDAMAVMVDFRVDSPSFGKTVKILLGEHDRKTLYLPQGVANSFANIGTVELDYLYMVTDYYTGKPTPSVSLQDPLLTRQFGGWPIENPIISEKDMQNPTFKDVFGQEVDFSKYPWLS